MKEVYFDSVYEYVQNQFINFYEKIGISNDDNDFSSYWIEIISEKLIKFIKGKTNDFFNNYDGDLNSIANFKNDYDYIQFYSNHCEFIDKLYLKFRENYKLISTKRLGIEEPNMMSIIKRYIRSTINILIKEVSKMCKENIPEDYETFFE